MPSPTTGAVLVPPGPGLAAGPSHFEEGIPELPPQGLIHAYDQDDVNQLADVARSRRGIQTLHEVTGGDPTSSPRWPQNMALGGDQELIAALRTPPARSGALGLYREPGRPLFDDAELAFVQPVASLAEGAAGPADRRGRACATTNGG